MISTETDAEYSSCSSLIERWKLFCLLESFRKKCGEYCICFPAQAILKWSLNLCIDNLSYWLQSLHRQYRIGNISYLFQSLDKQSFFCKFYITALVFSLPQIQHKPSFLLVLIPTQAIFSACFNPKIGNLRYLCNFSSFRFYSSED